jgi:ATP-dependent Clp protease ATP-binding subunit ClpA
LHLVVQKAHGDPQLFDGALKKALARLPSQDPPTDQITMAPALSKVIILADKLHKTQRDSYIAVDHMITALAQDLSIQMALSESNINNSNLVHDAVQQIRGTKKIDSKTADGEEENEILKKCTIDMTSMARNGEIDPVIGREEEIRRLISILPDKSKNNPLFDW